MTTWAPRLGALLAALAIMGATLIPVGSLEPTAPFWCVLCGDRAVADAMRNVLLFLPLGVALGVAGWPAGRVIGSAALLSFGIELTQSLIPGRDPSLTDLAANTMGAAIGAWVAGWPAAWLVPTPARAARLAASWCLLVLGMLAAGRLLMTPDFPVSHYYGQWVPHLGHLSRYGGSVRQVRLGSLVLPDGPLDSSQLVRASLLTGDTLVITVTAGSPTRGLAPIFGIADDRGREIVLVGADGENVVLRYRTRASRWRLEQPGVRFPGSLRLVRRGDDVMIAVTLAGHDLCLVANGRRECRGREAVSGLTFIVPESWLGSQAGRTADLLWIAAMVLPMCYWLLLTWRRA